MSRTAPGSTRPEEATRSPGSSRGSRGSAFRREGRGTRRARSRALFGRSPEPNGSAGPSDWRSSREELLSCTGRPSDRLDPRLPSALRRLPPDCGRRGCGARLLIALSRGGRVQPRSAARTIEGWTRAAESASISSASRRRAACRRPAWRSQLSRNGVPIDMTVVPVRASISRSTSFLNIATAKPHRAADPRARRRTFGVRCSSIPTSWAFRTRRRSSRSVLVLSPARFPIRSPPRESGGPGGGAHAKTEGRSPACCGGSPAPG